MSGIDGSGNFSRAYDWTTDRDDGLKIKADRQDTELDNIAAALTLAHYKDGRATATANWNLGGYKITNLGTPTNSTDAATKAYVDAAATSVVNFTVRLASTTALTKATDVENGDTIDGVVVATGDRVLLKNQAAPADNGIWVAAASGAPTRATDMDTWTETLGAIVNVTAGTANAGTSWRSTANTGGTISVTSLSFVAHGTNLTLPVALGSGGTGVALTAQAADSGLFYDFSAGMVAFFTATLPIAFSGTALTLDIANTTNAAVARGDKIVFADVSNSNAIREGLVSDAIDRAHPVEAIVLTCSGESSVLSAGTGKITFRLPYAFTVTDVRASLNTAQTSGSIFTVDINETGTTILSTKLTIDNNEKTSTTAATPAVISDTSLASDAEVSVDVDQIGNGTAAGLKVIIIGRQT